MIEIHASSFISNQVTGGGGSAVSAALKHSFLELSSKIGAAGHPPCRAAPFLLMAPTVLSRSPSLAPHLIATRRRDL